MTSPALSGISSMATRELLAGIADAYRRKTGVAVAFESVGGIDAAKRLEAGEAFDLAALAADAIDRLLHAGRIVAGTRTDFVRSSVAIAVRAGTPRPDVSTEFALRATLQAAGAIGYSTGPSGVAVLKLLERWGIAESLRGRLVQAPAGVPVGRLLAEGRVELGFQQLSELLSLPGIEILGPMPPGTEIVTVFSAGICAASPQPAAARAFLAYLASTDLAEAKRRHGMEPA